MDTTVTPKPSATSTPNEAKHGSPSENQQPVTAASTPASTPITEFSARKESQGIDVREGLSTYLPKREYQDAQSVLEGTNLEDAAPPIDPLVKCQPIYELHPCRVEGGISDHDVHLFHKAHHADPFSVLGAHRIGNDKIIVRAWVKDAVEISIRAIADTHYRMNSDNSFVPMDSRAEWLFEKCFTVVPIGSKTGENASETFAYELEVAYLGDEEKKPQVIRDAFSMGIIASDFDLRLFQSGSCWHVDNLMGSHITEIQGARGVRFVVWAPNAQFVSAVGDWNSWDGRAHPMRKHHDFGVWEIFIPGLVAGLKYGYRIHSHDGKDFIKIDPYSQEFENPPAHASVISACDDSYKPVEQRFKWTDQEWMETRMAKGKADVIRREPMAIYEVHLPSWMRGDNNSYLSYRQLADPLVRHLKTLNFTHVEFLPLAHHPFEPSWGYQVSGQYAPYSRLGSADDLKFLINELHKNDIGVFLDFVPAHFCKDDWGLVGYDGVPCYEYADPKEGEHKGWGTRVFNFRRNEVRSFLLGAAYHWLRRYHIDGLRIDAVSSMLYKNYCRDPGEWIPNEFGGDANLQAISLLQEMNWVVHKEFPGVFTMAEESTSWQGVTDPEKGLGFDAKWDLGWMNDTLKYLTCPPDRRADMHSKLTFRGLYLGHEKWLLPLSHDEVVSGKGSILDKCGYQGTSFGEKLKCLRALWGFQIGMPGRPLSFMGNEFGQGREWNTYRSLDWHEAAEECRSKVSIFVADLLATYRFHKALHAGDDESWNFQWTDCDNAGDCVVAWLRKYQDWYNDILIVTNFSSTPYYRYPIGVPHGGEWQVLINSDDWRYGGGMHGPGNLTFQHTTQGGRLGWPYCLWLDIPGSGCLFLRAPQAKGTSKPDE